jgi:hypothetical protein
LPLRGLATDELRLREPSAQHRVSRPEVLSVRKVVVYELLSLDGLPSIQLQSIRCFTSPSGHLLADYRVIRQL